MVRVVCAWRRAWCGALLCCVLCGALCRQRRMPWGQGFDCLGAVLLDKRTEQPVSMTTITRDDIDQSGARTLNELKERDIRIVGTSDDATQTLYDVDLSGPVALVLGAEGAGMRQLTGKTCDDLVRLPMKGAVESLNVSVASGVCLYEALRQREHGA